MKILILFLVFGLLEAAVHVHQGILNLYHQKYSGDVSIKYAPCKIKKNVDFLSLLFKIDNNWKPNWNDRSLICCETIWCVEQSWGFDMNGVLLPHSLPTMGVQLNHVSNWVAKFQRSSGYFFFYWNVLLISETRVDLFINYNSIEQLQLSDVNWWRENSFDILFFLPSTNICNVSCLYEWKMAQSHVLQIVVW